MTVPNEPGPAIGEPLVGHLGQEGFGLRLDRLGEQAPGTCAQHRGQRIIDLLGLRKTDNDAILCTGPQL